MNILEKFKATVGAVVAEKAQDASAQAKAALEQAGNEAKNVAEPVAPEATPAEQPAAPDPLEAVKAEVDELKKTVAELKTANDTQAKQIAAFIEAEADAAKAVDEGVATLRKAIAEDATKAAQATLEAWKKDNLPRGGAPTGRQIPAASDITDEEAKAQADIAAFKARINKTGGEPA